MFKLLFKGSLFKLFDFVRPLIVIPFFIRIYGLESYGIYVQIVFISTLLYPILDMGIGMSIQRFSEKYNNFETRIELFDIQKLIFAVFIFLFILIISLNSVQNLLFGQYKSTLIIVFTLVYILLFSANNTLQGVLRADSKISRLVLYRGIFAVFEALLLITILFIHKKFDFVYIAMMAIGQLFYFLLLDRESGRIMTTFNLQVKYTREIRSFYKYSLLLVPIALIGWVTSSSDRFFITSYFGAESTGYYSAISQYTGYMKLIVFPFTFVYFKDYSKFYDQNFRKFLKFYGKTFIICLVFSLIYLIAFYLLKNPIFKIYVGIDLRPELKTLTLWFLITYFFVNISSFMATYLLVVKQTRIMLIAIILGAILNFCLNKFLLHNYDFVHAVYYHAISVGLQITIMGLFIIVNIFKYEKGIICG